MPPRHTLDFTLEALMTRKRRELLTALREHGPRTDVATLVSAIDGNKETHIETHHVHLPLLDERGFVEWNETTGEVRRGRRFVDLEAYLGDTPKPDRPVES